MVCTTHLQKMEIEKKVRAKFFWGRFSHMQGTLWEWNVEKLEGGGSQILQTSHLHGVTQTPAKLLDDKNILRATPKAKPLYTVRCSRI